ncbi:MAG: 23S rRNA (uracil(1939)-C(5))-methyltransferase RlmD [Lachnospiraceae bacterium]|nr:23S rRNA (uracil(1939)-C(5))-methyltransferase RlmD [Lachnospiraceae bacterium]
MKKGQVVTGIVERVDFPNKGIVKTEDGVCVVKNALPGQKVRAGINKVRKGKAEGRLLEVEEKSPIEIDSPCPHFGLCGGCTFISLPYEEQLAVKEGQVKRLLDSVLNRQQEPWIFEGIKASPVQFGYRNKMEFSFGDEVKDGPLSLGMHKRGSFYDIVSVTDCQIVDADYRAILTYTRDYFAKEGLPFYHRLRHEGFLRHLLVRKAARTGEILVALVTTSQIAPELQSWVDGLLALSLEGKFAGILHIINDSVADVVKSDETRILYGQDYFYEELLGLKFKISTFSFFQTNSLSAEVLYETAREYVGDLNGADKVVYDLYSGTGTIAQLMAPVAKKVIGVEIVEEAVEAAKKNAELNGLHNCEFIAGDVLKVLDTIEEKPDMIILDPPRDGIHPKALGKIIGYGIERMVYISCKPTSLVRDLETFLDSGYVVEKAVAVDQFPWTTGIETVAVLKRVDS